MDASSVRIRTDALDERLFERFDGVFVIGGSGARTACDDPVVINALRKLLSNSNIVKWNDAGRRLVAATGHASAMSTADVKIGDFESRQYTSSPRRGVPVLGHDVDSLLAAALSLVTGDLGTQIARRINRRVASPTVGAPESDGEDANEVNAPDRIHRAAHWLRENCRRSISVAQAAEIAGMSERNFLRRFKLETAMTPSEFLLKARFEMSCRFLRETNLPVDKIARRCGMGSGERLSRVFRRRLAQTPTEYRAAHGSGAGSA
jgi:AraC-like DNA-binding protein